MVLTGVVQALFRFYWLTGLLAAQRVYVNWRLNWLLRFLDCNEVNDSLDHAASHRVVFLDNLVANFAEPKGLQRFPLGRLGADGTPGLGDA